MSGGELDYLCYKINDAIDECYNYKPAILKNEKWVKYYVFRTKEYLRFFKHLSKVSQALHDLEWVMSGDMSRGDEIEAIRAVMKKTRRKVEK